MTEESEGRRSTSPRPASVVEVAAAHAATGEYVDMLAAGIVDPAKVTRSGLQNAASIAGMVLTTECIVADLPEKKEAAPAGGGMGGGDFDY